METLHKEILTNLRKKITRDLEVHNNIISNLTTEYILNENDVKRINKGNTEEEKAGILLDILPGRGPLAFDVFHQSLKSHYEWLSNDIDELLGNYKIEKNGVDCYSTCSSIPPISPLSVTREEKITQLKKALRQLEPNEYITLHGMKGFGKSSLAAITLKDTKLVKNLFSCKIYWIKFVCERSIDDEILIQLNTLYHYVKNLEMQPESSTPLAKDSLIRFFKHHFSNPDNQNALLILDDVFDKKIINTFDFECKTLVLTTDTEVLDGRRSNIIEMNDGFTEAETLGLFAKVLDISVNELPPEAKKIHEECKGMPLLIAMFAAQFEEFKEEMRMVDGQCKWKYYLNSLRKKDPNNRVIKAFLQKQETIFDICINQLKPELKKQYENLAIFNEDVNITRTTLEIIWGVEMFRVEELMLDLCHKSLAAKQWNKELKSYVYGVHDLLLCHLRKKLSPDDLVQMHKSVVKKYHDRCNGDFSKLPNDNYIYSYIGYHLKQAELTEEFQQLYLDFDFIQAKITHSGLSDLLLDLKKYRKYIINNNDECEAKVSDLETFLQEQASIIAEHRHKKCLDIIQVAMNYSCDNFIKQRAIHLAQTRQKYLYLSHDKDPTHNHEVFSEEVSTGTYTSSFTDNPNLILTGNTSGKVLLWNCENKRLTSFHGHSDKCSIKKIVVSKDGKYFLTLTDTGIVKLFALDYDEHDYESNKHLSPREKQKDWSNIFVSDVTLDDSLMELSVPDEIILDMAFGYEDMYIATCTNKGTIQIWNRNNKTVSVIQKLKPDLVTKITFTDNGALLHAMNETKGSLYVYCNCNDNYDTYEYTSSYNPQLQEKNVIFFHRVPKQDNSLMIVTTKKAIYVKWRKSSNYNSISSFIKQERAKVENDTITYICAAITYDGKYLVVADSADFVNIWDADTGYQPIATYRNRVTSLDTYWLEDEYYHLICGNDDKLIHRWKFPIQNSTTLVKKSLFDAIVQPQDKMDIVVKESHGNSIVVMHGKKEITEFTYSETGGKIVQLQLFSRGNKVLYVTERNKVVLFDIETKETFSILEIPYFIDFVKILNINDNDIIICRETENSLRIWQNTKVAYLVNNTGRVVFIHKLSNDHVVTISQNGIILIWQIEQTWQLVHRKEILNSNTLFSCLSSNSSYESYERAYLAVLMDSQEMYLYNFIEKKNIVPTRIETSLSFSHYFEHKLTYCDISKDNRYIAVGFETGHISIIDIPNKIEIKKLLFHSNPIKQLSWAPLTVDAPILLSLANDELAWWNVCLDNNIVVKRQSRMGVTQSKSIPSFNTNIYPKQMQSSRSVDTGISDLQGNEKSYNTDGNRMTAYWKNKVSKHSAVSALLAAVELSQCRTAKVCISPDFTKFITVDIYGSVSTFKPFGYINEYTNHHSK